MPCLRSLLLSLLVLLAGIAPAVAGPAAEPAGRPRIAELVAANSRDDLLLYLSLADAFDEKSRKAVANGIPITIVFNVEVIRARNGLPDNTVASLSLEHVLSYDTLKDEYLVRRESAGRDDARVRTMAEAEALISAISDCRIVALSELVPDGQYILRARARQVRRGLPLKLHYLIPFYSFGDFNTGWQEIRFRY